MKGDKVFLDTNILIYAFDLTDEIKRKVAMGILCLDASLYISVQVVNEFINVLNRKIQAPADSSKMMELLQEIGSLCDISDMTFAISKQAVFMKERYRYSFWDSMIIASALENEVDILYSEDMQHGQLIDGKLKIVNPFI